MIKLPGTIEEGSSGELVRKWQTIMGVSPDGKFGPKTRDATIDWQRKHGLTADGVVGPITWAYAIGEKEPPRPADNIHAQERTIIDNALPNLSEGEKQALQAVSLLESSYGRGWKGNGKGSKNRGAITGKYEGKSFVYEDSRYDDKTGKIVKYTTEFRAYPTDEAAIKDLERVMYGQRSSVRKAAKKGDLEGVSRAMRETSYYLGTLPKEQSIKAHYATMQKNVATIVSAAGLRKAFGIVGGIGLVNIALGLGAGIAYGLWRYFKG
jgi:putative peptidoglycan binding protein